jgi:DDE superfamily endonuclease
VLDELLPTACQMMEQYANNAIEADHGRLKSRLRPMRGLTRLRSARVISAGHAFVQTSAVVTTTSPLTSSRAVSSVKQRPPVARRTDTTGGVSRSAGQRATGLVVSGHVFLSLGHVFDDTQIKIRR